MPPTRRAGDRPWPSLGAVMILITGLATGLALAVAIGRGDDGKFSIDGVEGIFLLIVMSLGGLSLVGPPLLLALRRRRPRPWRAGRILWFSTGTAAWLLWPPVVHHSATRRQGLDAGNTSAICFAYGTPLMALYLVLALTAGGWLGRRRRRRAARSWEESFGLVLGLVWACTGLYVLYLIYKEEL